MLFLWINSLLDWFIETQQVWTGTIDAKQVKVAAILHSSIASYNSTVCNRRSELHLLPALPPLLKTDLSDQNAGPLEPFEIGWCTGVLTPGSFVQQYPRFECFCAPFAQMPFFRHWGWLVQFGRSGMASVRSFRIWSTTSHSDCYAAPAVLPRVISGTVVTMGTPPKRFNRKKWCQPWRIWQPLHIERSLSLSRLYMLRLFLKLRYCYHGYMHRHYSINIIHGNCNQSHGHIISRTLCESLHTGQTLYL